MSVKADTTFTWYAAHPQHGELVLTIPEHEQFRYSYIYCPRMIIERLGSRINPLIALELSTGPCGLIPRYFYEEAGLMTMTPIAIRLIAVVEQNLQRKGSHESLASKHDKVLSAFILQEWENVYK